MVEVGRHINIELLTLSNVLEVNGQAGDFTVRLVRHPRYVDIDKCIACGLCAEKCPRKIDSEYDQGLVKRKAIYIPYAQAVPLKYAIDDRHCIYLTKSKCKACKKFCPADAINFDDHAAETEIHVGAVVLSSGSCVYDPSAYDIYGYQGSPNIVTSLEFERILSASGPYAGHLVRPLDNKEPKKIAWIQCVGSRDVHQNGNGYCSGVCCTYAIKEAILAKEHSPNDLDAAIFYIDIRTTGKNFEDYYNHARDNLKIRFIKSRIPSVEPINENGMHLIRYLDEKGGCVEEEFDMVVLSVGLQVDRNAIEFARRLDISLDPYHFVNTSSFHPVETSRPGVYVCGALQGPKDIPTSIIDASAAAGMAGSHLHASRWSLTLKKEIPKELDIRGIPPNIGVFICCCGTNIAGFVDVPAVVEYARGLPGVVFAQDNLFSCSQDTQQKMCQII
ncbi:MAG: FAD-dependent oxidoreductase, partial [Desulfobacterales bacterium]|nr:FAD-dependent oxidoreductase [Desulfobacterales bacterium]